MIIQVSFGTFSLIMSLAVLIGHLHFVLPIVQLSLSCICAHSLSDSVHTLLQPPPLCRNQTNHCDGLAQRDLSLMNTARYWINLLTFPRLENGTSKSKISLIYPSPYGKRAEQWQIEHSGLSMWVNTHLVIVHSEPPIRSSGGLPDSPSILTVSFGTCPESHVLWETQRLQSVACAYTSRF